MNFVTKWVIRLGVGQLDGLKPVIAGKIREAQSQLNNISPDGFAQVLVDEIESAILEKLGIPKEEQK